MLKQFFTALALRFLALHGQGFNGYIGLGKETTWGTAVAPTDYIEAMSENLSLSLDRYDIKNIIGQFNEPDDVAGMRRVAGDIAFAGHPIPLGYALKAAMNTVSGSTVLSGFLYTTRFVTTKSEFAAGVPSQPYTLEVFRDVTSAHRYQGCVLDKLTLAAAPNQDLRIVTSWIGQDGLLNARSTPTFPSSPTFPFAFDTCSIAIGGAGNARVEAIQIAVNNQLAGIPALNVTNKIARLYRKGPQLVDIRGTLDFADYTEYLDFVNQTERALTLSFTQSASFQLIIVAPRFVYTAYPQQTPGRDRLTVQFEGNARYLASSLVAIDFQLTNTKSNY